MIRLTLSGMEVYVQKTNTEETSSCQTRNDAEQSSCQTLVPKISHKTSLQSNFRKRFVPEQDFPIWTTQLFWLWNGSGYRKRKVWRVGAGCAVWIWHEKRHGRATLVPNACVWILVRTALHKWVCFFHTGANSQKAIHTSVVSTGRNFAQTHFALV